MKIATPKGPGTLLFAVDPGVSGAVALFADGVLRDVIDLPLCTVGNDNCVDGQALYAWIASARSRYGHAASAVLENVHCSTSRSGSFAFGRAHGTVEGVLAAAAIERAYVAPAVWKAGAGIPAKAGKKASLEMARDLSPGVGWFDRAKDHGRADAVLIGRYWLRREAAHWRLMAGCLDDNGDAIGAAELLSMADINETIADRGEALA